MCTLHRCCLGHSIFGEWCCWNEENMDAAAIWFPRYGIYSWRAFFCTNNDVTGMMLNASYLSGSVKLIYSKTCTYKEKTPQLWMRDVEYCAERSCRQQGRRWSTLSWDYQAIENIPCCSLRKFVWGDEQVICIWVNGKAGGLSVLLEHKPFLFSRFSLNSACFTRFAIFHHLPWHF